MKKAVAYYRVSIDRQGKSGFYIIAPSGCRWGCLAYDLDGAKRPNVQIIYYFCKKTAITQSVIAVIIPAKLFNLLKHTSKVRQLWKI